MSNVLIPLGLLGFIVLFGYAIVREGRRQESAKRTSFRDFARRHGFRHHAEDDGAARRFARDLDGIGRFESPTLGKVIPKDVLTGKWQDLDSIVFRHSTRFYEGYTRAWWVAGVFTEPECVSRCAVQFFDGAVDTSSLYLEDDVVEQRRIASLEVAVRAPDRAAAGKLVDSKILEQLARTARGLPFLPEIQLRPDRIAVYPAKRNATLDSPEALEALVTCAGDVARICAA